MANPFSVDSHTQAPMFFAKGPAVFSERRADRESASWQADLAKAQLQGAARASAFQTRLFESYTNSSRHADSTEHSVSKIEGRSIPSFLLEQQPELDLDSDYAFFSPAGRRLQRDSIKRIVAEETLRPDSPTMERASTPSRAVGAEGDGSDVEKVVTRLAMTADISFITKGNYRAAEDMMKKVTDMQGAIDARRKDRDTWLAQVSKKNQSRKKDVQCELDSNPPLEFQLTAIHNTVDSNGASTSGHHGHAGHESESAVDSSVVEDETPYAGLGVFLTAGMPSVNSNGMGSSRIAAQLSSRLTEDSKSSSQSSRSRRQRPSKPADSPMGRRRPYGLVFDSSAADQASIELVNGDAQVRYKGTLRHVRWLTDAPTIAATRLGIKHVEGEKVSLSNGYSFENVTEAPPLRTRDMESAALRLVKPRAWNVN